MLYPLIFHPIFKERVWGGRRLKELYSKELPEGATIGESWEISDRPGDSSIIANGPLAGKDLRWLMERHPAELLGSARAQNGRFPLLIKLLDCRDTLSLQVHPPSHKAAQLGGEPKTEMWFIADAIPGAQLFVGLKSGATAAQFRQKVHEGTVADCFHRIQVKAGDAMFLPSGRVHALGAGMVIFEIQQNSDTTYRVFDWNRVGLDGKPRDLHIAESLESIDFEDFEPGLVSPDWMSFAIPKKNSGDGNASTSCWEGSTSLEIRHLVQDELFDVDLFKSNQAATCHLRGGSLQILGLVQGGCHIRSTGGDLDLSPGQFCLIPASVHGCDVSLDPGTTLISTQPGD
ncbi:MAG: class I mannose-6-phosphate isomerase [Verrucomicrobia bacterium]|nr:class I mannose-6-phosphate isomerase [Verrucomicrobiota bacterium]